jgi:DNA polymerase/3'-5' exonuclease PolX
MENPEVAQILEEIADLLEIQDANPFRVRAYRRAAQIVGDLGERLVDIVRDPNRKIDDYPGIGSDLAEKITTIVEKGDLPLRCELQAKVPAGLRELLSFPNVGPKRAALFYKKLKIASLGDLRAAAEQHRIARLKGFGEKSEQAILKTLSQLPGRMNRELEINNDALYAMSRQRPTNSTRNQGATATIRVAAMIAATNRFKSSQTARFVGRATGNRTLA